MYIHIYIYIDVFLHIYIYIYRRLGGNKRQPPATGKSFRFVRACVRACEAVREGILYLGSERAKITPRPPFPFPFLRWVAPLAVAGFLLTFFSLAGFLLVLRIFFCASFLPFSLCNLSSFFLCNFASLFPLLIFFVFCGCVCIRFFSVITFFPFPFLIFVFCFG